MSLNKKIRKILFVSLWVVAGGGVIALLVAAVNARTHQVCKGLEITIKGPEDKKHFLDRNDIIHVITGNGKIPLKNQLIKSIDLNRIETRLKREQWIGDAELFFDNSGKLKVAVTEREPVARVFTSTGQSFYIDSSCKKLPLSSKSFARLPVFTGYPFSSKKIQPGERRLLNHIKELSLYLSKDAFWMAQVAQVDITPSREFEIIPTVGNHVIEFGTSSEMEQKLQRLMIFYQQVLSKTGMNKYERIKVQYDGQVIGVKKVDNN